MILRRYVFNNYTWDKSPGDFSKFADKTIPARVPLTALISGTLHPSSSPYVHPLIISIFPSVSGPIAGDPFPPSSGGSPAVIPEFFDEVCPNRTIIDRDKVNGALERASAATIIRAWLDELERTEDRCVEIKDYSPQIFDFWYDISTTHPPFSFPFAYLSGW